LQQSPLEILTLSDSKHVHLKKALKNEHDRKRKELYQVVESPEKIFSESFYFYFQTLDYGLRLKFPISFDLFF